MGRNSIPPISNSRGKELDTEGSSAINLRMNREGSGKENKGGRKGERRNREPTFGFLVTIGPKLYIVLQEH